MDGKYLNFSLLQNFSSFLHLLSSLLSSSEMGVLAPASPSTLEILCSTYYSGSLILNYSIFGFSFFLFSGICLNPPLFTTVFCILVQKYRKLSHQTISYFFFLLSPLIVIMIAFGIYVELCSLPSTIAYSGGFTCFFAHSSYFLSLGNYTPNLQSKVFHFWGQQFAGIVSRDGHSVIAKELFCDLGQSVRCCPPETGILAE